MGRPFLSAVVVRARRAGSPPRPMRGKAAAGHGPFRRTVRRLALLVAAVAMVGLTVRLAQEFWDDFDFSAASKTVHLSAADVDPESTTFVLRLLRAHQVDGRAALALLREGNVGPGPAAEYAPSLNGGRVPPPLIREAEALRAALENGQAAVYTVWLEGVLPAAEGTVTLLLDGRDLGTFPCGPERCALSLLLRTEIPMRLRVRAAAVSGRVLRLRAQSAAGEAHTRKLRAGRTDEWLVVAHAA